MAATDILNDSNFSESSFIEDFDRMSESSSVLQSSPEPLQAGSPGTDQNLSNAVNEQMTVSSAPSRKRGTSSATQENDNSKKACLQWLTYFNEKIVYTKRIEIQDVFILVKPQRPGIAFPDLVKKAPKQNLHLTGRDLHVYSMGHLVNNNERVDSLQISKGDATLEEAKAFLLRADTALRLANKHLLAISIEVDINFERSFEIHQAEKKNGLVPYWEHWIKEFTHLGKRQIACLRQISRFLAPFPKFKQLSVPFTEIFERHHFIQHMLQDENIAKEWK